MIEFKILIIYYYHLYRKNSRGQKNLCISYIGHGARGKGDWCFSNGNVSLQDILDLFRPGEKFRLLILSDCCYSGKWERNLWKINKFPDRKPKYHVKEGIDIYMRYYSSCSQTEQSEEMVFTRLIEGHDPDYQGGSNFQRLDELIDKP